MTDKVGVIEFARGLVDLGFEIISTGGTASALRSGGLHVRDVSDLTGFPELLDGRLKTLHPKVHGGLLGKRSDPEHAAAMEQEGLEPIDLLCVNLYRFEQTVSADHTFEQAVESIDIGGPAMIRAASKNFQDVLVVVDPEDYESVLGALREGATSELNLPLAAKAFRHTAVYDSAISRYLTDLSSNDPFPEALSMGLHRSAVLRYGENPHQRAALYRDGLTTDGIANAKQIWGKELSYNNILDADAAWELANDLADGACAILKHGNPCGVAIGKDLSDSYQKARNADPVSAFGGIVAARGVVDAEVAATMTVKGTFLEVVIATQFTPEAVTIFKERSGWGESVRLLEAPINATGRRVSFRSVRGGALAQDLDFDPLKDWSLVTHRSPSEAELEDLKFMWTVVRYVKSNAIVVGKATSLLGVGAGQMNRVQSVRLALEHAGAEANGAVLASDAFFPFPDSVEGAAAAGITAIVQPGGSKKDRDVISTADRLGVAMMFTGARHFRH